MHFLSTGTETYLNKLGEIRRNQSGMEDNKDSESQRELIIIELYQKE